MISREKNDLGVVSDKWRFGCCAIEIRGSSTGGEGVAQRTFVDMGLVMYRGWEFSERVGHLDG